MDFESIINMPVIGQTIAYAIEDGRQWGLSFANNRHRFVMFQIMIELSAL